MTVLYCMYTQPATQPDTQTFEDVLISPEATPRNVQVESNCVRSAANAVLISWMWALALLPDPLTTHHMTLPQEINNNNIMQQWFWSGYLQSHGLLINCCRVRVTCTMKYVGHVVVVLVFICGMCAKDKIKSQESVNDPYLKNLFFFRIKYETII